MKGKTAVSLFREKLQADTKVLVGLGEEWKSSLKSDQVLHEAYEKLYSFIKDKDYFIITMATDGVIFDTPLGNEKELVASMDKEVEEPASCFVENDQTKAVMDKIFPPKAEKQPDTRWQRIVAPCGNENWRQCAKSCTKDIWEPGEIPEDICPHCGAPLIGNTVDAPVYIEEGYLPQWQRYTQWLTKTLNQKLLILELGVGFEKPGVIRFPFEKTGFFNQKAYTIRVHHAFPQLTEELQGRGESVMMDSVEWLLSQGK